MTNINHNIRSLILLVTLWVLPFAAGAADVNVGGPPGATKPCFIVVNEKMVFDGSKVTSIEIVDSNLASRLVVVNFGNQHINIVMSDDTSATKYLSDLVMVIQKACR